MTESAATPPTAVAPAVPTATYRLQLQPDFPFAAAEAVVPHLAALGVSHLHLSPVLQAVPGSTHGYDVVDHTQVREELGGEKGLRSLARTARSHGLGLVLDVVPNHMAVPAPEYLARPLWEVLREGPESPYARWFDIDWAAQGDRLLLPVLGAPLEDVLDDLRVERDRDAGERVLRYHDHAFPLRPGTGELPLRRLLDAQWYRLAWWRQARSELNYRRFFTISELIAVRVEDPEVFAATHATLLRLLDEGVADGLRIDHPDGLADPAGYLRRLAEASAGRWTVVEKILTGDERLPAGWACAGTTGYDALDRLDGLFTDPAGAEEIAGFYREFTGAAAEQGGLWEPTVRAAAHRIVVHDLAAEVDRLTRAAVRATGGDERVLREALREVLVRLPRYRPYVVPGEPAPEEDVALLEAAAEATGLPAAETIRDLALGRFGDGGGDGDGAEGGAEAGGALGGEDGDGGADVADFAVRFAQVSSALRAKSAEDTAFYRYYPLLCLNEVGREPDRPATSPEEFHAFCERLRSDWPLTGTVRSTHDTKRSADVRARLAALTELPGPWARWLTETSEQLRAYLAGRGVPLPERHVEYQAWQYAAVFCDPAAADLVAATMLKSEREAGLRTAWTDQRPEYERELTDFVRELVGGPSAFATGRIADELAAPERVNALGAHLAHLTMPGVPDVYQGDEERQLLLVDPANRAPYDPGAADGPPSEKRLVTVAALRLRRSRPQWFTGPEAGYEPLYARGTAGAHCVAFVRGGRALTVVTRLSRRLAEAGGWRGTELVLPEGVWTEVLTDRRFEGVLPLEALLDRLPVGLLVRDIEH
ncbi:malto-oligosyltrehalose synthase [Streptomyces sp. MI02-7b]|uniref:malto-oligosyltrehalose synthase n=1 Tax=Streptomyces sp. MI02-7b TaxID=462941 RepID=UPI0029A20163|nr:malto-oligosyltrehalose synthase [Streptomyces sp. MI02-7b]MDX3072298.1 malto-oligosyltrehalose synthase [Streptomyces sp. MI02-7b]